MPLISKVSAAAICVTRYTAFYNEMAVYVLLPVHLLSIQLENFIIQLMLIFINVDCILRILHVNCLFVYLLKTNIGCH